MTIVSWVQGNQLLVGGVVLGVLIAGVSIGVFFIIRSFGKKIKKRKFDVPPESPVGYKQAIGELDNELEDVKMVKKKDVIAEKPVGNLVDVDKLSVEELKQLVKEKEAKTDEERKRATLMEYDKKDLVQMIIDNQLEI